jgi:hypothetical protein
MDAPRMYYQQEQKRTRDSKERKVQAELFRLMGTCLWRREAIQFYNLCGSAADLS